MLFPLVFASQYARVSLKTAVTQLRKHLCYENTTRASGPGRQHCDKTDNLVPNSSISRGEVWLNAYVVVEVLTCDSVRVDTERMPHGYIDELSEMDGSGTQEG